MTQALFGRSWSLTVSKPNDAGAIVFTSTPQQGEPLHFVFDIERTLHSEANKAKIQLFNLSATHRAQIDKGSTVVLKAGYGSLCDTIFRGTAAEVVSESQSPEIATTIEAGDGEPYLTSGLVNLTYRATTTLAQVLQDICSCLQLTVAGQVFKYRGFKAQKVPRVTLPKRVVHGTVKEVLDGLLHPLGMMWSIECGLLLIQNDYGVATLEAQVLSSQSGLLGLPKRTASGISFQSLILPTIAPGLAVQIESVSKPSCGNWRVISAKYSGDTHGPQWTIDAMAQPLTVPLAQAVSDTSQTSISAAQASPQPEVEADAEEVVE